MNVYGSQSSVELERHDHVAIVALDRPTSRNALTTEMKQRLLRIVEHIAADKSVRSVVFLGRGPAFCVGEDVKAPAEARSTLQSLEHELDERLLARIADLAPATIAGLHGFTLGRGLMLGLACDIRFAGDDLQAGMPEVKLGLFPALGATHMLARLIGSARATHLALTGEFLSASRAEEWGLVTRVVEQAELDGTVLALAEQLASHGPVGMRFAKMALRDSGSLTADQALLFETLLVSIAQSTDDWREGVRALKEKRPPQFKGE